MMDSYRGMNGAIPSGQAYNGTLPSGGSYAPHQYFPPRMMYPHSYNPQMAAAQFSLPGYRGVTPGMAGPGYFGQGPPQYRHPPPVQIHNTARDMEVS